jgi:uncharacterized protein Yka (UPF0111/DUF47 family)
MKRDTTIIPFPSRNDHNYSKRSGVLNFPPPEHHLKLATADSISDQFANTAGYYDLINEQCDILADSMRALLDYMQNGGEANKQKLTRLSQRIDSLRKYHLAMLAATPIHADKFLEISRVSITLDITIEHTRFTTVKILGLSVPIDSFMLKMARDIELTARALNQGILKLATNPLHIERDIRAVLDGKKSIEKAYHCMLARLRKPKDSDSLKEPNCKHTESVAELYNLVERRDVYDNLFKISKRLAWTAARVEKIASNSDFQA